MLSSCSYGRKAGKKISLSCILFLAASSSTVVYSDSIPTVDHVIQISIDGLVPSAIQAGHLKNFDRIRTEGAGTDNARADYDVTQTLPSHISHLTGLTVEEHRWYEDKYDGGKLRPYRQNIFDLVSESPRNWKACMFVSKEKFKLFRASWEMDVFKLDEDGSYLTGQLIEEMTSRTPCKYAFMHVREPDTAGHKGEGTDAGYHAAVKLVDHYLGDILDKVENTPNLAGKTAIILTTDHGFANTRHGDQTLIGNYQIPFYVWGPGVEAGKDLYELNPQTRQDPGKGRPDNAASPQPIRHLDAGVMAADFLGIKPSSGRFSRQDVAVGSSPKLSVRDGSILNDSDKFFCGKDWTRAKANCATAETCPSGSSDECPTGQRCFADIKCFGATSVLLSGGNHNFCGNSWQAAERKCKKGKGVHCPQGLDTECPGDQKCFGGTSCTAANIFSRKLNLRGLNAT